MTLYEELASLVRLFQDATDQYEDSLMRVGNEDLSHEWRRNVGDVLDDVWLIGKALVEVYGATPEKLPEAMKHFTQQALIQPEIHTRGHITRLKDILEGRLPSWPEGEIASTDESFDLGIWRAIGELRRATEEYVSSLRAAGMGDLAVQWKDALWKMTWEAWMSGEYLASVNPSFPHELPGTMRNLFRRALHQAEKACREPMARLKEAVK